MIVLARNRLKGNAQVLDLHLPTQPACQPWPYLIYPSPTPHVKLTMAPSPRTQTELDRKASSMAEELKALTAHSQSQSHQMTNMENEKARLLQRLTALAQEAEEARIQAQDANARADMEEAARKSAHVRTPAAWLCLLTLRQGDKGAALGPKGNHLLGCLILGLYSILSISQPCCSIF